MIGSENVIVYRRAHFVFAFAQRARTAFLAISERSSLLRPCHRARPPFSPPLRPSATAAGFFFFAITRKLYKSGLEKKRNKLLDYESALV